MANPFTAFGFAATGQTTSRTLPNRLAERANVKDFGAIADGTSHPLSTRYASLAAAQADYPGVTSLAQEIDWTAIMAALTADDIFVVVAQHVYAGTVRVLAARWAANTATITTTAAHGLTTGDEVYLQRMFSSEGSDWNGSYSVTVIDSVNFYYTLVGQPGPVSADPGYFSPVIAGATWASNVVTVTFNAPHRLVSGLTCIAYGFSGSADGSRVISVTGARTLQFPLTGGGAISVNPGSTLLPLAIMTINPGPSLVAFNFQYLQENYPTCTAASYVHSLIAVTGSPLTGLTLSFADTVREVFWSDIEAGATVRIGPPNRGLIYLPHGQYEIAEPIQLDIPNGSQCIIAGSGGGSIIHGNFADFLLSANQKAGTSGPTQIEKLTFVNDHAGGSGVRLDGPRMLMRDCSVKVGLNGVTTSSSGDYRNACGFQIAVENCIFQASSGATSTVGINAAVNDMTIAGCYFIGLSEGIRTANFFFVIKGNQFINCGFGVTLGMDLLGASARVFQLAIRGNVFRNCGGAIRNNNSVLLLIRGLRIIGGASAIYGLNVYGVNEQITRGADISGLFSEYAIYPCSLEQWDDQFSASSHRSVRATNSGGLGAWPQPLSQAKLSRLVECNFAWVTTYDALPGRYVAGMSYNAGTGEVTLTTDTPTGLRHNYLVISGVTVGGGSSVTSFNGTYVPTLTGGGGNSVVAVKYDVATPPGTWDSGTGIVTSADQSASPDAAQGRTVANISDGAKKGGGTAAIGDLVGGGGSQHIKVAWTQNGWMRAG